MNILQMPYNAVNAAQVLLNGRPSAPGSTAAAAKEPDTDGETWISHELDKLGGMQMSPRDGKNGPVFKNGESVGQAKARLLAQWNSMSPEQRQQAAAASRPARRSDSSSALTMPNGQTEAVRHAARGGGVPVTTQSALSGISYSGGLPHTFGPSPHANARFNAMGDADVARMDAASSAVQRVQQQQRAAEDAAMGVSRQPDGTVRTAGGGTIQSTANVGPQPAGAPSRALVSPYGTGGVTTVSPGQPRKPGMFRDSDGQMKTLAQVKTGLTMPQPAAAPKPTAPIVAQPAATMQAQAPAAFASPVQAALPKLKPETPLGTTAASAAAIQPPAMPSAPVARTGTAPLPKTSALTQPNIVMETPIQSAVRYATDPLKDAGRAATAAGNIIPNAIGKAAKWATTPRPVTR